MYESISKFFAPKAGDIRVRDIIRELPGGFSKAVGQPTLRSFWSTGTEISKVKDKITGQSTAKTPLSGFEKKLLGTEERPSFSSQGKELLTEKFANTKLGKVTAPVIGFGLAAMDLTGGGKKEVVKKGINVAEDIVDASKMLAQSDVERLKSFLNIPSSVDKKLASEAVNIKDLPEEFRSAQSIMRGLGLIDPKNSTSMDIMRRTAQDLIDGADVTGTVKKLDVISEAMPPKYKAPVDLRRASDAMQETTRYVDYKYKPNLNTFDVNPATKAVMEEIVQSARPYFEKAAGGRLNNEQIKEQARKLGTIKEKVIGKEESERFAVELQSTSQELARKATVLEEAITTGQGNIGDLLADYMDTFKVVQSHKSNLGYQLQAVGIKAEPKDAIYFLDIVRELNKQGVNIDDIVNEARKIDPNDFKQVADLYRKFIEPTSKDWINLVRYNSMLSSPLTQAINIASTALNSTIVAPLTKLVAGGFDFMAHPLNKEARKQFASEVGPYVAGYVKSLGKASNKFMDVWNQRAGYTNLDLKKSVPIATSGTKGAVVKTLSTPTRLLEAMDQFWMEAVTGAEMEALGYRAAQTGKNIDVVNKAKDTAEYYAFRRGLHSNQQGAVLDAVDVLTSKIESFRNSENPLIYWLSNLTLPFVHTPMNIVKQGLEYSPAGFFTTAGKSVNKSEQLAKASLGSVIGGYIALNVVSDRISFSEPLNKEQADMWRKAGKQPYSIRVGDTWVSYEKIPPAISYPIAMTAAVKQAFTEQKVDEDTMDAILNGLAKSMHFYSDQSYFESIGDLLSAAQGDKYAFDSLISNYPQQFVPFRAFSGWLARLMDDTQRTVDNKQGFVDKQMELLFLNIPGIRENQTPRTDSTGDPVKAQNPMRNAVVPIKTSDVNKNFEEFLNDYDTYSKISKDESRSSMLLREEAEKVWNELTGLSQEEKTEKFTELYKSNKELADKVVDIAKERKGGITSNELMIKNLSVTARANYIHQQLLDADPKKRVALVKHYKETGIMTKSVEKELIPLLNNK